MASPDTNVQLFDLTGGLNEQTPVFATNPRFTPDCNNVVFRDGAVEKRTGFVLPDISYSGHSLELTSLMQDYTHMTAVSAANAPHTVFQTLTYHDGPDGKEYLKVYCAYNGDTADAFTWYLAGDSYFSSAFGYDYTVFTSQFVDTSTGSPVDKLLITAMSTGDSSVVFKVLSVARTGVSPYWEATELANGYRCRKVVVLDGRLIFCGMSGSDTKLLWDSVANKLPDLGTATEQVAYLDDAGGKIQNAIVLNGKAYVFKERSIWEATTITTTPYLHLQQAHPDIGLLAPRLITTYGTNAFFVGNNNIYAYGGGSQLVPIGGPIWTRFLEDLRDGQAGTGQRYVNRCFAATHRDKGEILFWIVSGTGRYPNVAYVYNIQYGSWSRWSTPVETASGNQIGLTAFGELPYHSAYYPADTSTVPLYGSLIVEPFTQNTPLITVFDYQGYSDISISSVDQEVKQPIKAYWDTQDFTRSLEDQTLDARTFFEAKGLSSSGDDPITVELYNGDSLLASATDTLGTDYDVYSTRFNRKAYKFNARFKDETKDKGFRIRAVEFRINEPEG